jgi:solute carrier family 8 (sodium/calcium exchanger)
MLPHQRYLPVDVIIIDDNQWEPDETFFVKISIYNDDPTIKLGPKAICMITIINDDEPGEVEFKEPVHVVKESAGTFDVLVERKNGADGDVSIHYKTTDINAIGGKDYEPAEGVLEFKHGEVKKTIQIKIIDGNRVFLKMFFKIC